MPGTMPDRGDTNESTWGPVTAIAALGIALVCLAAAFPSVMTVTGLAHRLPFKGNDENALPLHPLAELLKLIVSDPIGVSGTTGHKRYHRDRPSPAGPLQAP